jgi:inosine-uridine nucleoside N-ribohydrolase
LVLILTLASAGWAQGKRKVIFDQDAAGPGGTDMMSLLVFLQSPEVELLGVTVVTGDAWRDEEVAHALRLLELVGRTDVPVVPGAVFPLVRTKKGTELWEQTYGKIVYKGAWRANGHGPYEIPDLKEGNPTTKPASEDAAHFLIRKVNQYPDQITIYAGGPMTNLAQAISIDPKFAEKTKGLIFMGASINPQTDVAEFATNPRHEFNLWFDPEASHIVLRAHWPRIVCTSVDVSLQTQFTQEMFDQVKKAQTPAALYVAKYARVARWPLWDELTAASWLDPSVISESKKYFMDVSLERGAGYGDVLIWTDKIKPDLDVQAVDVQMKVDMTKFGDFFVKLLTAPTPGAKNPLMLKEAAENNRRTGPGASPESRAAR